MGGRWGGACILYQLMLYLQLRMVPLQLVRFPTPRRPSKGDKKKKRYKPNLNLPAGAPIIKKHKDVS